MIVSSVLNDKGQIFDWPDLLKTFEIAKRLS